MASSLEIVRVLIQDNQSPPFLTDDDINAIVTLEPNAFRAAATAARAISGKFSERVDMGGGSSRLALSQQADNYLKLADRLDARAQQGGDGGTGVSGILPNGEPELTGLSIDEIRDERRDPDRYDSVFYRGLDDNPKESDNYNEDRAYDYY